MALGTLASRLVRLEQTIAQRHNTSLNPRASLEGLDPQWVADEIAHCRADAVYFVDTYCKVESDTGTGVVPFKLFDYQINVLEQWLEHDECIVLKARQLGITELAAALALWTVNFHQHNKVIVFSQDEPKAKEFARKCRIAWEHLPAWLQTTLADPQKTTTLELANGSRILFDLEDLDAILRGCQAPVTTEHLGAGTLTIWAMPTQSGRYVTGADPAEG